MPNVSLVKHIGNSSALEIITRQVNFEYPSNNEGASSNSGTASNEVIIHLTGNPSTKSASNILKGIEMPTCNEALLNITVNVGTYIVNDVKAVVADAINEKFTKVSILMDDTTGVLEVYMFEKTTGEYQSVPTGKTLCVYLKEYSTPALGTVLTQINNFIR